MVDFVVLAGETFAPIEPQPRGLIGVAARSKLATSPTLKRRGAMCDCDLLFGHRRLAGSRRKWLL